MISPILGFIAKHRLLCEEVECYRDQVIINEITSNINENQLFEFWQIPEKGHVYDQKSIPIFLEKTLEKKFIPILLLSILEP